MRDIQINITHCQPLIQLFYHHMLINRIDESQKIFTLFEYLWLNNNYINLIKLIIYKNPFKLVI